MVTEWMNNGRTLVFSCASSSSSYCACWWCSTHKMMCRLRAATTQWDPQVGGLMQRPPGYLGAGSNSCCLLTYVTWNRACHLSTNSQQPLSNPSTWKISFLNSLDHPESHCWRFPSTFITVTSLSRRIKGGIYNTTYSYLAQLIRALC